MNDDVVIPKGLFGRDHDFRLLLHGYERCCETTPGQSQELVFIRGKSGAGKSFLANSLLDKVKQDSGYFLVGKFELTANQNPYAVFVSAFSQFIDELFADGEENKDRITAIQDVVQAAVGNEGKLLTDVIPSLERVVAHQQEFDDACDINGKEALNRFHFVFCKFCRALSTVVPLVLFLDDLQWGDSASLDLLITLLQSQDDDDVDVCNSSLLVVGTFRDEEIDDDTINGLPKSNLSRHLDQVDDLSSSNSLNLTNIILQNLDESSTNEFIATYLELSTDATSSLGKIVYDNCQGNPFHAMQLLRLLVSKGHIHRDPEQPHKWTWRDQDISAKISSVNKIDELVREKLDCLPQFTQKVLQHAACMGDDIDILALETVLDGALLSDIDSSVKEAASGGHLVLDRELGRHRFAHDRIRQTVLSMVDDTNSMSFQIGYKLWTKSSPLFLNVKLFLVTSLLNHGTVKLTNQEERYKAAALYLEAAIKAASLAAFPDACRYARAGIEFLEGGDYWNEQYKLSLSLFDNAIDAEVCNQNFDRVMELASTVFDHARIIKDTLVAHIARINSLGQLGKVREALEIGLDVVRQLGERVPEPPFVALKTKLKLRFSSNERLMGLAPMQNEEKIATMHILAVVLPYAFFSGAKFTPIVATKLAGCSLLYGIHKCSALGFAAYGLLLCGKDRNEGYRLGKLAMSIVERYRARELIPHVHVLFYGFIYHWKCPLRGSVQLLANLERTAMELGNIEHAIFAIRFKCNHGLWCGMNLGQVEEFLVNGLQKMKHYKQLNAFAITAPYLQYIHNLTGRAQDPKVLSGEAVSLYIPSDRIESMAVPYVHYMMGMDLAHMFGDYELARETIERRLSLNFEAPGTFHAAACRFKEALICVASARNSAGDRKLIKMARRNLRQMKLWARDCPENFLHKQRLIEAELLSCSTSKSISRRVLAVYDESIKGARREGFVQEAALACELCGDYVDRQGQKTLAVRYWEDACKLYAEWGATEKVALLSLRIKPAVEPEQGMY